MEIQGITQTQNQSSKSFFAKLEEERKARVYKSLLVKEIRKKYSADDELAILRQKDTKPEEYTAWNNYVEKSKAKIKAKVYKTV